MCNMVKLTTEGARTRGLEDRVVVLLGRTRETMRQWERDLRVVKLLHIKLLRVLGSDDGSAHDLDRTWAGAVATSKLRVHLLDGFAQSHVTVFLVHVVGATSGVVADPDAIVVDHATILFSQLVNVQDLACSLLHLLHLVQKIPKARLSQYRVGCKELHAVRRWVRLLFSRRLATNDLKLTDLFCIVIGQSHCMNQSQLFRIPAIELSRMRA